MEKLESTIYHMGIMKQDNVIAFIIIITTAMLLSSCNIAKEIIKNELPANGDKADFALRDAICDMNLERAKEAIEEGSDVTALRFGNVLDNWEISPILLAMEYSQANIMTYLLEQGSDPNYVDDNGITLLTYTAGVSVGGILHETYTVPDYMRLLIDYGADVNKEDKKGQTALDYALQEGSPVYEIRYRARKMLLDNGASVSKRTIEIIEQALNKEDMTEASATSEYDIVAEIVRLASRSGENLDISPVLEDITLGNDKDATKAIKMKSVKKRDMTNLVFFTAAFGAPETMDALIETGVSLDMMNKRGQNPACVAARYGNLEMVKYLDQRGVDIKSLNDKEGPIHGYGGSAIDWAIYNDHLDVVKYLFEHGAEFSYSIEDEPDSGSLAYAAQSGLDVLKYVYENSKEISNESIANAMTQSIYGDRVSNLAYLAEKYSVSDEEVFGDFIAECCLSPFPSASVKLAMVKILVENGMGVRAVNGNDDSENEAYGPCLIYPARSNRLEIMSYLTEHGADVNAVDVFGDSPIKASIDSGNLDALKYLVEHGADLKDKDVLTRIKDEGYDNMLDFAKSQYSDNIYEYVKDHM
jgi:ankyrin repeat protein